MTSNGLDGPDGLTRFIVPLLLATQVRLNHV